MRYLITSMICLAFVVTAQAQSSKNLISELSAYRFLEDGSLFDEALSAASSITPGDSIEYRLYYRNDNDTPIRNLKPQLPVPSGLSYLSGSENRKLTGVSLTNEPQFQPLPAFKAITDENGKQVRAKAMPEDYRVLQWTVAQLNPGEEIVLTVRMKVNRN